MGIGCNAAIRMFEFSGDFDRPRKARRGRVQSGKVFRGVPQPARRQHDRKLIEAGKAAGSTPLEITTPLFASAP